VGADEVAAALGEFGQETAVGREIHGWVEPRNTRNTRKNTRGPHA
jgi:hypothetical protein